jgi:hypothetical protein
MLKKIKIPAIVIGALLLLYTLVGFLAVPALVRSQAIDYLRENNGLALAIDKLRFNPYTLHARAEGVRLDDADGARLLSWDALSVNVGWRSLWERALVFQSIALSGPFVHAELQPDGSLNLAEAFAGKEEPEEGDEEGGIAVVIDEFVLDRGAVRFTDLRDGRGFDRNFGPLALRLRDFSTRPGMASELVGLYLALGERGSLTISGDVSVAPLGFDLELNAENIPLEIAQPYVPETLAARIADGVLGFSLRAVQGPPQPLLTLRGDASIASLAIEVAGREDPVLSWRELALRDIEFDLAPDRLAIGEIGIDGFDSVFRIYPDGNTNVGLVLRAGAGGEASGEQAEADETAEEVLEDVQEGVEEATEAFPFSIGRIVVADSKLLYNDRQIKPPVSVHIENLAGEITGVASDPDARVEAKLTGRVGNHGSADIGGHVAPFAEATDLKADVSFGNVEMTDFSPYAGKFAGYEIAKGKMFLELRYTLSGSRLQGQNHALFDQFELGDRVESEDATSLPVKFALSLLRDRHGRIDISLPVEGDVNAPGFRFGHLIGQVLLNTLTKIVTAPFSFIASVFGGGPDMEYVQFAAGTTNLPVEEHDKVRPLIDALSERPLLTLEIQGFSHREEDGEALRQVRLADVLAGIAAGGAPADDVLRRAYEAQFGDGAADALRGELEAMREQTPAADAPDSAKGKEAEDEALAEFEQRFQNEMQARLLAAQPLSEDELRALAFDRGRAVMAALVDAGGPADRIFVRNGRIGGDEDGTRARLILGAR